MKAFLFSFSVFFILLTTQAQITDSSKRQVKLQGAVNFRDIGGYKTKDGRQVKWGKIYRSAEINNLTNTDLTKLETLSIHYVLDFRGPAEFNVAPDKIPNGAIRISLPAGSEEVGDRTKMMQQMSKAASGDSIMLPFYTNIESFSKRYGPVFTTLLNNSKDSAVVIHCTAGKDRTGIGSALILYALGVDEKSIMADYLASNYYRQSDVDRMKKILIDMYHMKEEVVMDVMGVKEKYLSATFDAIKSKYGSIDNFLENEIGLTKAKREQLQQNFLE